jgi:hypothetical protein
MEYEQALATLIREISETNELLSVALASGDAAEAQRLLSRVSSFERRRNRLVHLQTKGARAVESEYQSSIPFRDQVLRSLQLLRGPATGRLISDVAAARWGDRVDSTMLSSLRRDELRSWRNAQDVNRRTATRDVYVVPALGGDRFFPIRGTLALSSWPLDQRVIAPLSPRVDMLKATVALAEETMKIEGARQEAAMRRLVARLGSTIPGVKPFDTDLNSVVEAAQTELAVLKPSDDAERQEAAARARTLDAESQLFGVPLRVLNSRVADGRQ